MPILTREQEDRKQEQLEMIDHHFSTLRACTSALVLPENRIDNQATILKIIETTKIINLCYAEIQNIENESV